MRIALLSPGYGSDQGGIGRHVRELARGVVRAGGQVDVYVHGRPPAAHFSQDPGVRLRHYFPYAAGTDYGVSRALWSDLRLNGARYDLVHAHGYRTLPAVLATRSAFRRLAFSPYYHTAPETRLRRFTRGPYQTLGRSVLASANLVLCASSAEALLVRRLLPVNGPSIEIVPHGADVQAIMAAEPHHSRRNVVLCLGPLERGKRIDRVISALPDLGDEFELVVAGGGSERRGLEAHAADMQVADRVRFLGALDDHELHRWLRTASVLVALSETGASGVSLLEAACADCPVVASDTPGHRETAETIAAGTCLLLPTRVSPLVLADQIRAATATRVQRVVAPPSWHDVADRGVRLYSKLLAEPAPEWPGAQRREADVRSEIA